MPDWDDPDLDPSPVADRRLRGQRRPRGRPLDDLECMHHRRRNALEDYAHMVRGGAVVSHDAALARLGLTKQEWHDCIIYAARRGLPVPSVVEPPLMSYPGGWHCGSRTCNDCNRTEVGRRLHTPQHANQDGSD